MNIISVYYICILYLYICLYIYLNLSPNISKNLYIISIYISENIFKYLQISKYLYIYISPNPRNPLHLRQLQRLLLPRRTKDARTKLPLPNQTLPLLPLHRAKTLRRPPRVPLRRQTRQMRRLQKNLPKQRHRDPPQRMPARPTAMPQVPLKIQTKRRPGTSAHRLLARKFHRFSQQAAKANSAIASRAGLLRRSRQGPAGVFWAEVRGMLEICL